ncbi:hypothetical protein P5P86_06510 [Nocardioides sp. BP30]|uniref:anti-sigma factor family protein n=1 Tax=Nocardioides sp. BP30 TaxID=3036374 RepID=UPI0024685DDE|nr:hypothetical protein [Nocardioides sp. BP30]WGL53480.1 hypothetical protein P5P86_06510 [Nocardioides sp. BP30]
MIGGWGGGHLGDRTSALLDGQLGAEETERAWEHVQGCHVCRDRVEREGWLKRRLAGLSHDPTACEVPDSLKGTLLGAPGDVFFGFHTEFVEGRSHRRAVGLAALGGSAVGAAVMGVLAFGAAPASAPTTPLPAAAVNSVAPTPIVATLRQPAP